MCQDCMKALQEITPLIIDGDHQYGAEPYSEAVGEQLTALGMGLSPHLMPALLASPSAYTTVVASLLRATYYLGFAAGRELHAGMFAAADPDSVPAGEE